MELLLHGFDGGIEVVSAGKILAAKCIENQAPYGDESGRGGGVEVKCGEWSERETDMRPQPSRD